MKYNFFSNTDVGQKRGANEDAYGDQETPNGHVFVVCDGMGGHAGGARASNMAVSGILEFFAKEPIDNLIIGIDKAISFANEQIFATAQAEPEFKGMGTTVTVTVINDDDVYIGHVGDSRIYLKSNGKLNRITKDHSKVQELVDHGIISDADAESHPEKNVILRALGIKPEVQSTICSVSLKLSKGDVLMMCSDGLSGLVTDDQMLTMINFDDLQGSVGTLIAAANNNGGPDNITATLIGIAESKYMSSVFQEFNPVITQDVSAGSTEPTMNLTESNPKSERNWKLIILSGIGGIITLVFLGYLLFPSDDDKVNKSPQKETNIGAVNDTIPDQLDGDYEGNDDGVSEGNGGEVISEPGAPVVVDPKPTTQNAVEEVSEQTGSNQETSPLDDGSASDEEVIDATSGQSEGNVEGQEIQEESKQSTVGDSIPISATKIEANSEESSPKVESSKPVDNKTSTPAGEGSTEESESGGGNDSPQIK